MSDNLDLFLNKITDSHASIEQIRKEKWLYERKQEVKPYTLQVKKEIKRKYLQEAALLMISITFEALTGKCLEGEETDLETLMQKQECKVFMAALDCITGTGDFFIEMYKEIKRKRDLSEYQKLVYMNTQKNYINEYTKKLLEEYEKLWDEAIFQSEAPEKSKNLWLDLIKKDSPGTYKAIIKLIELNRVQITQDNKLNFISMKKGTVAHIFKEGGFTEWNRVIQFTLIDGNEDTGSLKNLAASEPPKEYENIKKDIYQN